MIDIELDKISKLPTGKVMEVDQRDGLLKKMVYQRVQKGYGNRGDRENVGLQRRVHVIPVDPKTEPQITQRGKMSSAVAAWKLLTEEDKQSYRKKAEGSELTGYKLFVGLHMKGLI